MGETLKDLLTRAIGEEITEQEVKDLDIAFGKAINNQPCPCESGNQFNECCKMSWNLFLRMKNKLKQEKLEENKTDRKVNEAVKKNEKGIQWLIKVGITKDQSPVLTLFDGVKMSPIEAAKILLNAYHHMTVESMNQGINIACQRLIQQISGEQAMPRPGIIRSH